MHTSKGVAFKIYFFKSQTITQGNINLSELVNTLTDASEGAPIPKIWKGTWPYRFYVSTQFYSCVDLRVHDVYEIQLFIFGLELVSLSLTHDRNRINNCSRNINALIKDKIMPVCVGDFSNFKMFGSTLFQQGHECQFQYVQCNTNKTLQCTVSRDLINKNV